MSKTETALRCCRGRANTTPGTAVRRSLSECARRATGFAAVWIHPRFAISAVLPVSAYDIARRYMDGDEARAGLWERDEDELGIAGVDDDEAREILAEQGWTFLAAVPGTAWEIWGRR